MWCLDSIRSKYQDVIHSIFGSFRKPHNAPTTAVMAAASTAGILFSVYNGQAGFFVGLWLVAVHCFRTKRVTLGISIILVTLLSAPLGPPLYKWMTSIGADSLSEAQDFDLSEAAFFITTIAVSIKPKLSASQVLLGIVVGFVTLLAIERCCIRFDYLRRHQFRVTWLIGLGISFSTVAYSSISVISVLHDNARLYRQVEKNFSEDVGFVKAKQRRLSLVVYIGESTSAMHMSLYGYVRATTPKLKLLAKTDPNLLIFKDVLSTHTHTSPSLLSALSLRRSGQSSLSEIYSQKRASIVEILRSGGREVHLVSNQGMTGTWNMASSIIFRRAIREFSVASARLGNQDYLLNKPYDHEYLLPKLSEWVQRLPEEGRKVLFLHSYAGHGPYQRNIPERFRTEADELFRKYDPRAIVGEVSASVKRIEEYDGAVRYIDYTLARAIEIVRRSNRPIVLVYFADHGESPFTGRGHDSSRFVHEMVRVPLLLFFNSAARVEYSELFESWRARAQLGNSATLEQLALLILDLTGVEVERSLYELPPQVGEEAELPPVVVRRVSDGISFVNLSGRPFREKGLIESSDDATRIFRATKATPAGGPHICYHRSNTIAKAIRGASVANCLEFDVVIGAAGPIQVTHPPVAAVGFDLDTIWSIAKEFGVAAWIDAKDISGENCDRIVDDLKRAGLRRREVLLEFPSSANLGDKALLSCAVELQRLGVRTSYYVPTERARQCAKLVTNESDYNGSCLELEKLLQRAAVSGMFTDFSFDYRGLRAFESIPAGKLLGWNVWNVDPDMIASIQPERFFMIIAKTADPNSR